MKLRLHRSFTRATTTTSSMYALLPFLILSPLVLFSVTAFSSDDSSHLITTPIASYAQIQEDDPVRSEDVIQKYPPPGMSFDDEKPQLVIFTNSKVYSTDHKLQVYGTGLPEEHLIIRLFAPDGSIAKFDQVTTAPDGSFDHDLLIWPEPSSTLPYGTYAIEAISTEQSGLSLMLDVKFTSTTELVDVPVERHLNTLVIAPETAAITQPIRVFVQITSDGLLIGDEPSELLQTTHVHLPSGLYVSLSDSFKTLHQGLYFADYEPVEEGTHVFHVVAFSHGTVSHSSAATTVLTQDLGGISEQIILLNSVLDETSSELETLKSEIERFDSTLDSASMKIDGSIQTISSSVESIGEASFQLNSLLFPIIASIGIIVALQIAILARRR